MTIYLDGDVVLLEDGRLFCIDDFCTDLAAPTGVYGGDIIRPGNVLSDGYVWLSPQEIEFLSRKPGDVAS